MHVKKYITGNGSREDENIYGGNMLNIKRHLNGVPNIFP
jgi:hypothetical protein